MDDCRTHIDLPLEPSLWRILIFSVLLPPFAVHHLDVDANIRVVTTHQITTRNSLLVHNEINCYNL